MKQLSIEDRPREKLRQHGAAVLGDNELLAVVLGSGSRRADALDLANQLLDRQGGLRGLARSGCADLSRVPGVGPAKAAQITAAIELGRRTLTPPSDERVQLRTPRDAAAFLLPTFGARAVEQFGVVLLDIKHRVIRTAVIATGTYNSTIVQPRDVFREAILESAASIVAFHNHPSGDPSPSADDMELTRRLAAAGTLIGIDVADHLVLGDTRFCSFREMGRLA
jgi:DNA repair protein RadC